LREPEPTHAANIFPPAAKESQAYCLKQLNQFIITEQNRKTLSLLAASDTFPIHLVRRR
jgi:hypothetical protein